MMSHHDRRRPCDVTSQTTLNTLYGQSMAINDMSDDVMDYDDDEQTMGWP